MKIHLGKLFTFMMAICLVVLACFIYKDFYYKPTKKNDPVSNTTIDDGKIHLVFDAGHGGKDVGAIGHINKKTVVYEKDMTRKMVDAMMELVDTSKYTILQTRATGDNAHRHDRMVAATYFKPHLLISFHCNSNKVKTLHGTEIHICDSTNKPNDSTGLLSIANPLKQANFLFADSLLQNICSAFPALKKNKVWVRKDRIWMIYAGKFPSVLIEWGYLSNKTDLAVMNDSVACKTLAKSVWHSINQHFGFEK